MLAALIPSSMVNNPASTTINTPINQSITSPTNLRSNGSSFGWGNRERKMEENWRMQSRNT
jgi:hypothetical protein